MHVIFDVLHLYYLPQYLPVYQELKARNCQVSFVFYHSNHDSIVEGIIDQAQLTATWVNDQEQATKYYLKQNADWIVFANAYPHLDQIHTVSKSVQLGHGIGPKASYYTKSDTPTTVRFVEGAYRTARFNEMYPNDTFIDVGFSKLDPIISGEKVGFNLDELGLNDQKPTLVYAPTFYPSSIECFPKNWPSDFTDYNILIKPHYFSVSKEKYKKQQALLNHWSTFDNVYLAKVEDYSLVPFLATADILISDASSALFEFAALNKPVIWCDFLKLRWSYRGIFSYRFKKRMDQDYGEYADIAVHAQKYRQLRNLVDSHYQNPKQLEQVRLSFSEKLAGKLDGQASKRIADYLLSH
ncbi:CDP-glycerol--poly(glycerophosphate) glycerophosphotransferase [Thalassotalea sp. M1531]|uniref:CDP-glycerol--poly(Glycerophosphate) glycerophosphotransferase n=1 Tax=Thalassotalea algicola TaxID=2716224 RepID=A0A7Y0LCW0_9GAMM|nr:CDP-glycerol glycerophosphotransferase family protein [Thalassotalea algicola]NMP32244.1 CDP-glycerol--poly(glycerophosphate) glycerophosphotransferase [Thalassotalea algicola]